MTIKTYKRLKGTKAWAALEHFLSNHGEYSNTYFWRPPSTASGRRQMEFDHDFSFAFEGKTYKLAQGLSCSCSNVYWTSTVHVDGEKKNIRTVKKLLGVK